MTRAEALQLACLELGLTCELDYGAQITETKIVKTIARIVELGDKNGMLIVGRYDEIELFTQRIADLGFGFAVLGELRPNSVFDIEGYKRMFCDWGWSGSFGKKPSWM